MNSELFIENQPVDVSSEFSTLLTFSIDDIKEPGARECTFSKTIILPGTARNNKVFNWAFDVTRSTIHESSAPNVLSNYNAAKYARCIYFQGNIQVFKGVMRILRIIEDKDAIEYEVAMTGELSGFVAAIGSRKLEDIDWTPFLANYDLNYTEANIVGSWNTIGGGDGLYFPLIDYGNYSAGKRHWDYRTFRPAFYAKDYIDKIFYYSGYSYECDLFDTARFKRFIIPHNQKTLTKLDNRIAFGTHSTSQNMLSGTNLIKYPTFVGTFTPDIDSKEFTYTGGAMSARIELEVTGYVQGATYEIQFIKNGAVTDILVTGGSMSGSVILTSYNDYLNTVLNTGDVISLRVTHNTIGVSPQLSIDFSTFKLYADNATQVPLGLGDTIELRDIVPKGISQREFFSSILKMHNLYVVEDKMNDKKLIITPYIDYYNTDPATFKDWTYKLDRSRPKQLVPMSELNCRYYEFNFASDSDYYNDQYKKRYGHSYGSRIFDSQLPFVNDSAHIELIFAGTPLVGYSGEDKVYSTIFKRSGNTIGAGEENVDSVIRILQAKKITGVTSWNLKNAAAVLNAYTDYGYAGHLDDPDAPADDLNFGVPKELFFTLVTGALNVNNWNVFWSPYFAEITDPDSKLLTATFRLTDKDIDDLDFSKFVYVDGSIWRLKKIEDYNASTPDTCKCTLLKAIYLQY